MSSVTAVPLRPITKGSLVWLWIGIAALLVLAIYLGWRGTEKPVALHGTPAQYMAWNGKRAGVVTTASGLEYQVIHEGEGAHPTPTDVALVAYTGRLRDGKVFDKQDRAPVELSKVIPGWTEGLQLMAKGAKYRFWIPPQLGYGDQAAGDAIPANSVLEFDVELIDFIPAAVLRQQMQMQGMGGVPGGAPVEGVPGH